MTTRPFEVAWHDLGEHDLPWWRGDGPRRPVAVALHGLEDSWTGWRALARRSELPLRILALDLPWRAGNDYGWARQGSPARWLAAALQAVPEPVDVLIGHSFGANAILQYLATEPAPVRAALLAAPFFRPAELRVDEELRRRARHGFSAVMREGLRLRMGDRPAVRDAELLAAMGDKMLDRIGPRGFELLFDQFVATTVLDLRHCRVPTLVVAGTEDESLRGPRADALARAMPSATVRLDRGYSHFCHLEQPRQLAAQWAAYLRTVLDAGAKPIVPEGISR